MGSKKKSLKLDIAKITSFRLKIKQSIYFFDIVKMWLSTPKIYGSKSNTFVSRELKNMFSSQLPPETISNFLQIKNNYFKVKIRPTLHPPPAHNKNMS